LAARRSMFKACRNCGALVPRDAKVCPICQSTQFTEAWQGILIIIDKDGIAARLAGRDKPGVYAIRVMGRR